MMQMLVDEEAFTLVEQGLRDNGALDRFERDSGEILGRVMITLGDKPVDRGAAPDKGAHAFICSFDFYDCELGVMFNPVSRNGASGIWVTPQREDAEQPSQEWVEFFIGKLLDGIDEDGGFGVPICSFVNNESDLTVVPAQPD